MSRTEDLLEGGLAREGIPYRTQDRSLPGTPDFVLTDTRIVVFVHGCYWHRHEDCGATKTPQTRTLEWADTFREIVHRDQETYHRLEGDGWWVIVAWECEINQDLDGVVRTKRGHRNSRIRQLSGG